MFRCSLIALAATITVPVLAGERIERPNILLIMADDYGIDGVGCYGSDRFKGKTPHLDALAQSGMRFERCYSTPICGPSRILFMTGRYPFRTGGLSNDLADRPTPSEEPSVAKILKQAGYVTGMAGKWRQMGGTPGDWAFDEYLMSDTGSGPPHIKAYTLNGRQAPKPDDAYFPDMQQEFARDFIRRHRDQPFFFHYASHLVHDPIVRTPDSQAGESKTQLYDDNVAYLDKQVGQLVAELDKLGLRERTLIVFTADNGTDMGRGPATIGGRKLYGGKRDLLEGGTRVPLIANWKGAMPAGRVLKDLVDLTDMLPTFTEVAGAKLPQGITFDGRSFAPQLRGETGTPREWVFVQLGNRWFVRSDGWKLNSIGELFDMQDAPWSERLVLDGAKLLAAAAAQSRLQAVVAQLDPASGKAEQVVDNQLTPAEKNMGWRLLFNGKNHEGWQCNNGKPIATPLEDGSLVPFKAGGYLIVHKDTFGDFHLECDVKMSSDQCNSGIFFRVGDLLKPVQTGFEIQVAKGGTGLHDFGAIYDLVPPAHGSIKPVGEWNHVAITCRGPLIAVRVNGDIVASMNCDDYDQPGLRPDGSKHKFGAAIKDFPRRGYLGFQDHGHKVWYKNVKLLEIMPNQ
jgi:arylsulfatase A-like enzyme